jgi:hypothetical protein
MKLSKAKLKRFILEALSEVEALSEANGEVTAQRAASATDIKKALKGRESQQEVGKLAPRERQVVGALQSVQKAMAQPGNQANQKVVMLVQRLIDELKQAKDITTDQGEGG